MSDTQELGEMFSGFLNGSVLFLYRLFSERRLRNRQKEILRKSLSHEWKWRSFKSLCRAIREDEQTTKALLIEIGARSSTKRKDVWTLLEQE
jgi:hypothetical protein